MSWIECQVASVEDETPIDRSLVLEVPAAHAGEFLFRPGQHVRVRVPARTEGPREGFYSLSSAPSEVPSLTITVRARGEVGSALYTVPAGAGLRITPPSGSFVLEEARPLLLLAAGSGIAPYRSFLRHLAGRERGEPVTLVHSVRTREHLLFRGEVEALARRHPWLGYDPAVTTEGGGAASTGRGRSLEAAVLDAVAKAPAPLLVYACGPAPFVTAALAAARTAGVPAGDLRREVWGA